MDSLEQDKVSDELLTSDNPPSMDDLAEDMWNHDYKLKDIVTEEDLERYPILKDFIEEEELNGDAPMEKDSIYDDSDTEYGSTQPILNCSFFENSLDEIESSLSTDSVDNLLNNTDIDYLKRENINWWPNLNGHDIEKKIIQTGIETLKKPRDGDLCVINLISSLENGTILESYFNRKVPVGSREISEGFDIVIKTMHVDECARVKINPQYLFDKKGIRYDIPPKAHVVYIIRLLNIERQSSEFKNSEIKASNLENIVQLNDRILLRNFFENFSLTNEEEEEENKPPWYNEINMEALEKNPVETTNKIAVAELLMEDRDEALETINHVLAYDPTNMTALFLKDTVNYLIKYPDEEESEQITELSIGSHKSHLYEDSSIPILTYAKIKDIKDIAIRDLERKKKEKLRKFKSMDTVLWILVIGASTVTLGTVIKRFFF